MTVKEVLRGALKRLRDEKVWIKGAFAKTGRRGRSVESVSPRAVCFCLAGAITATAPDDNQFIVRVKARRQIQTTIARLYPWSPAGEITAFNDARKTKHADVLRVLRAAIREAA